MTALIPSAWSQQRRREVNRDASVFMSVLRHLMTSVMICSFASPRDCTCRDTLARIDSIQIKPDKSRKSVIHGRLAVERITRGDRRSLTR